MDKDGMVCLKQSAKEKKAWAEPAQIGGNDYPYDTRFSLGDEHVQKLFGKDMPNAKDEVEFRGKGFVHHTEAINGKRRLGIQMTDVHVGAHKKGDEGEQPSVRSTIEDTVAESKRDKMR